MTIPRSRRLVAAITLGAILGGLTIASALARPSDLQMAKVATARFNSLQRAHAAGYGLPSHGPLHDCIADLDGMGAMGFHLINDSLLDATIDPTQPEALVYAPDRHGKLKLVALEYVVFQSAWEEANGQSAPAPSLFGEPFLPTSAPNRYEIPAFYALHAWLYQPNADGTFAPFNNSVSC